jgi:flavodoxin
MKTLIVVSSKTGNTRKIAEAIAQSLPTAELYDINEAPNSNAYDLIYIGFWVDKGAADEKAKQYMNQLTDKNVALFATLGAYPDSDHAAESLLKAAQLLPSCKVLDSFICQGAIDPKLIAWMSQLPADHPHAPDDARIKRWNDAKKHPDTQDCQNASNWAQQVYSQATATVEA